MRAFVLAAVVAGSLAGAANAVPPICNEPWQPPAHPQIHTGPCHERPSCTEKPHECSNSVPKIGRGGPLS